MSEGSLITTVQKLSTGIGNTSSSVGSNVTKIHGKKFARELGQRVSLLQI
jgi:hypothetical protein